MPFKEFTTRNFLGRNSEIEGLQGVGQGRQALNGPRPVVLHQVLRHPTGIRIGDERGVSGGTEDAVDTGNALKRARVG